MRYSRSKYLVINLIAGFSSEDKLLVYCLDFNCTVNYCIYLLERSAPQNKCRQVPKTLQEDRMESSVMSGAWCEQG